MCKEKKNLENQDLDGEIVNEGPCGPHFPCQAGYQWSEDDCKCVEDIGE